MSRVRLDLIDYRIMHPTFLPERLLCYLFLEEEQRQDANNGAGKLASLHR